VRVCVRFFFFFCRRICVCSHNFCILDVQRSKDQSIQEQSLRHHPEEDIEDTVEEEDIVEGMAEEDRVEGDRVEQGMVEEGIAEDRVEEDRLDRPPAEDMAEGDTAGEDKLDRPPAVGRQQAARMDTVAEEEVESLEL